ncbi:MAG: DUF2147 domain-containing protein [Treponema sp.]|nr:DUF2147 domain-containing protein [Treponema sp.]
MKKIIMATLAIFAVVICFADPAEGYWISIDEKTNKPTAGWEISAKDGKLSGVILAVADKPQDQKADGAKGKSYAGCPAKGDLGDLTVVGTTWIWDLKNKGEGVWADGFVIDPNDGKRYKCKITFHKADGGKYKTDTLEMRGEIGMGIGRSQYWKSATAEDIENMKK